MSGFKYLRGSEWRKWDLHVHTPYSYGGNYKKFVTNLEKSSADVVGINDYCSISGYEKILNDDSIKNKVLFPCIEFRMNNIILDKNDLRAKKGIRINFHIIFNNQIELSFIRTWLNALKCFYEGGKTESLGNIKDSSDKRLKLSFDYLKVIKSLEEDNNLKDHFLVWLPYDEYGGIDNIDPINDKYFKLGLIDKAHIIGSSNKKQIDFFLWKSDKHLEAQIKSWLNNRKIPCIKGSDSHKDDYPFGKLKDENSNPINKYCWIKADPTFEGLKQIIYEPELRVKIQQEDPRENEVYTRIEKCIIDFPPSLKINTEESDKKTDFCLQGKYEVDFSNNLTCIIGGRGIGKSTLVHLLYNVWSKKDISKLTELNSPLLNLVLIPDTLSKASELTTSEIPTKTEFFLQNEIEKFARDIEEMSKLIRHRLLLLSSLNNQISLKDLKNEWSMTSHAMNEIIEAYDNVSHTTKKIESVNKQIETLKKQIAVIKSKEYQNFQKVIEDINSKIAEFRRYKNEYNEIITKVDELISDISQLNWSNEQGKGILDELVDLLRNKKKRLEKIFLQLEAEFKTNNYPEKLAEKKDQLKKYLEKKGITQENIEELAYASEQIKELEDEIRTLEKRKRPYERIYGKRNSLLNEYKNKYSVYRNRFFEVATRLEKELKGLPFFDKTISFTPKINEQLLRESAVKFIKKSSPAKAILRTDDIQNVLFEEKIEEYIKEKKKIQDCVNRSTKAFLHKQILQELVNEPVFLEKLHLLLCKEFYDISNIQVQTRLGDKLLQNTSFGERCGIVISIILIAGTNPIIIDQPEDNLDGKFISNVLVPLIRKRKLCRQIILVTRDANIVIGGDAELIHILENAGKEKKTKILPTSIENIKYRENYIWILDGGKEAFEKRERKYGFKVS